MNPSDPWAWIGLAGDLIDVAIPFVGGIGEATRAINASLEIVDAADDIYDAGKAADRIDDAAETYKALSEGVCFVAGTAIWAQNGNISIEYIVPGDLVWAWDEETGDVALKEVVETYINKTDELIHVYVNGEEIVTTPAHPFYSPAEGWTEAAQLRAGDILVLVSGEYVVVEKVHHETLEVPVAVYNFQVEDFHTYYVSSMGLLVHNSCYQPIREGDFRAVINPGELEAPHAHIFQKANNIGRIFKNGKVDDSLKNNKDAMKFVKRKMDQIMGLIDEFYGKR